MADHPWAQCPLCRTPFMARPWWDLRSTVQCRCDKREIGRIVSKRMRAEHRESKNIEATARYKQIKRRDEGRSFWP